MRVLDTARLIIYRCHEKGLEVFMIKRSPKEEGDWELPEGVLKMLIHKDGNQFIELDAVALNDQELVKTIAIEADWHEIPSIRGLVKHDITRVKDKIKSRIPGLDTGSFFAIKEVLKTALPSEYKALKELKDILADRNTILNI